MPRPAGRVSHNGEIGPNMDLMRLNVCAIYSDFAAFFLDGGLAGF
jgi:hypothetical protein